MTTRRRTTALLAALTLASVGLACRSTPPAATSQARTGAVTCFNSADISSFVPLEGHFLYVQVGTNEHYLLTLDRPADTLRDAMHIQISPDFPRVCSNHRAPMTYNYQGHVGVYNIVNVEAVSNQAVAESLAAQRTEGAAERE
jgi:hypothetical protein